MEKIVGNLRAELAVFMSRLVPEDGMHTTAIPDLQIIRYSQPNFAMPTVYKPCICIAAQGRKQVLVGDEVYVYGPDECLVASLDLPATGQVLEATPEEPYLCLCLAIDTGQLSALLMEANLTAAPKSNPGPGMLLTPITSDLLDAVLRLVRLLENPRDIPILSPLFTREILYRLIAGEGSSRLRQIAVSDSRVDSIHRAIHWLKHNYKEPFRIETIAKEAHLSPSALHHHFKTVTAMSPLQYQKQLRLQEARRLMLGEAMDAASAAFSVGYESASQFSREYRRLFGEPPLRDIARLKNSDFAIASEI